MKTIIQRNYQIRVYPYDDDDEEYCDYRLEVKNICDGFVAMHIKASEMYETYMYLAYVNDTILFTDPDNFRGTLIRWPSNNIDAIYDSLEEIDEYDEEQCAILSSAIRTVWDDYFCQQRNILNVDLKLWEEELPF